MDDLVAGGGSRRDNDGGVREPRRGPRPGGDGSGARPGDAAAARAGVAVAGRAAEAAAPGDAPAAARSLFTPGRNVWRVARAERAAVLVDAAAYFAGLRAALLLAERTVTIIGWDIDSRTGLVGPSGRADDGFPERLGPFLKALVERRPALSVRLLLWDFSVLYSLEREISPEYALQWNTPRQIELCLDDEVPAGSAHHQKLVVIDDRIAFCGGLDLTIRRWDTPEHRPDCAARVDPAGTPYPPFHDVQMLVDGAAARALAALAAERWRLAACETPPPTALPDGGWPESVAADLRDVAVGIARTIPAHRGEAPVREIEALFLDMVDAAERWIYVENQFLTAAAFAERLAARLSRRPRLEALLVAPRTHHTWIEHKTMLAGRLRFRAILEAAGVLDRVRLVYPNVGDDTAVMVHAKVMIVDDRLLRVGSANLADRSMGADTECDLVVAAASDADRAGILAVLGRLAGEHCGVEGAEMAERIGRAGSLLAAVDGAAGGERLLLPIVDEGCASAEKTGIEAVADPARPLPAAEPIAFVAQAAPAPSRLRWLVPAVLVAALVAAVAAAWRFTGLAEVADVEAIAAAFAAAPPGPAGAALVIGIFVLAGLVVFPVTVLIAATAVAFGAWPGVAFAAAGALASALVTYAIGRLTGPERLRRWLGPRLNGLGERVARQGVVAVVAVRLVPVAPFTVVNLIAGALRIRLVDYLAGTFLGLVPGLLLMTALGDRLTAVVADPSPGAVLLLVGVVLGWIAVSVGLQRAVTRWRGSE